MSESFDFENFKVNWENRSDRTFWAIDASTFIGNVVTVDLRPDRNENPTAQVTVKFDEVRVTKEKPNGETVTEKEFGRELRIFFAFQEDWQLEQAYKYLIATGVVTAEELNTPEGQKGSFVAQKFLETQGKSLAVKVSKYKSKIVKEGGEDAYADPNGMKNGANDFFAEGSRRYELAANASSATIDTDVVATGGRRRKGQ